LQQAPEVPRRTAVGDEAEVGVAPDGAGGQLRGVLSMGALPNISVPEAWIFSYTDVKTLRDIFVKSGSDPR
jgi:hypothetical protein